MSPKPQVFFVDDDAALRASLIRRYHSKFEVRSAGGGAEALELMRADGPSPIVVSDYKMAGMNGVEFLRKVEAEFPDTVRIMLTGQADLDVAMTAVNEGSIFRFLTKPCPSDVLVRAVEAGMDLVRLRRAEKLLLERTLTGSIAIMCDVLELSAPRVFGRATRVREFVQSLARELGVKSSWKAETAALLAEIGYVTLPPGLVEKSMNGSDLEPEEREALRSAPLVAARMLSKVPRLEVVADIIAYCNGQSRELDPKDHACAQLVRMAMALEAASQQLGGPKEVVRRAVASSGVVSAPIVRAAVRVVKENSAMRVVRTMRVGAAPEGAKLAEPAVARDGTMLLKQGHVLNESAIQRLLTYVRLDKMDDCINVVIGNVEGSDGSDGSVSEEVA